MNSMKRIDWRHSRSFAPPPSTAATQAHAMDGAFLDLFWSLASKGAATRNAAVASLLEKVQGGDEKMAAYALKRLMGGLLSPRDGARVGCATALTSLLRAGAVAPAAVVAHAQETLAPQGGGGGRSDKREARACDLAKLLAADCVARSGVDDGDAVVFFVVAALELTRTRKWLRELGARCVAGLLPKAPEDRYAAELKPALEATVGDLALAHLDAEQLAVALAWRAYAAARGVAGPAAVPGAWAAGDELALEGPLGGASHVFPNVHVAWELVLATCGVAAGGDDGGAAPGGSDYGAVVAPVLDAHASRGTLERRGTALVVALRALEGGAAPSAVLTETLCAFLAKTADKADGHLAPLAASALKRLAAPEDRDSAWRLEAATALLERGGGGRAAAKAVAALVGGLDADDKRRHVRGLCAAALDEGGAPRTRALEALAALAKARAAPGAADAAVAVAARVAFFGPGAAGRDGAALLRLETPVAAGVAARPVEGASAAARGHAADVLYAVLADATKGPLAAEGLAPLEGFQEAMAAFSALPRVVALDDEAADAVAGFVAAGAGGGVELRALAALAACLCDHAAPGSEVESRVATVTAILEDCAAARTADSGADASLMVARACVALLHCAHTHKASKLARDLVKKTWASAAAGGVSDAAFSALVDAVSGREEDEEEEEEEEEEEDDEEDEEELDEDAVAGLLGTKCVPCKSDPLKIATGPGGVRKTESSGDDVDDEDDDDMDDEDDVSESEMVVGGDGGDESEEDVLLEGDALAEYLEKEEENKDVEAAMLAARQAGRKAGKQDAYRTDLQLKLRALDLLERCVGGDGDGPRCLGALEPLAKLAMDLDEGPDVPEARDLAKRLAKLVEGKLGKACGRAPADQEAAVAGLLEGLLEGLAQTPTGKGYFADVAARACCAASRALKDCADADARATAADAYAAALEDCFASKKSKLKTKLLKDCVARAPALAGPAFLGELPRLAAAAPSPFLAAEALGLLKDVFQAVETTDAQADAALDACAALVGRDDKMHKTDRLRVLLDAAVAVARKHPGAKLAKVRKAAAKVAAGHASSAVVALAAKLGAVDDRKRAAPAAKNPAQKKRKTAKK